MLHNTSCVWLTDWISPAEQFIINETLLTMTLMNAIVCTRFNLSNANYAGLTLSQLHS